MAPRDAPGPSTPGPSPANDAWERVGLHRQVSSFLLNILVTIGVKLPYSFVTVSIYARFIQPFPEISGSIGWIGGIFASLFLVLEMGTSVALTKFFAAHRVKDPVKAKHFVQVYVWWMLVITAAQATVVVCLGLAFFPSGRYAELTYLVMLSAIARVPGCLGVVGLVLDAMQHFSIKIKVDAVLGLVVNTAITYASILGCRAIFAAMPAYGEAFGAGMGMIAGSFISGIVSFAVFASIYRRMGYALTSLFRIGFSRVELKEMLAFGGKLTVGNGFYGITSLIQSFLVSFFVLNYGAELGLYGHVGNLTSNVHAISQFSTSLIPALSEAEGNQKRALLEYTMVQGLKWSYFLMLFLAAIFFAIGPEFLAISGPQWLGALKYVTPYVFFCCWWPLAWFADAVFQGTGHPGYNTLVWYVEQGTRLVLLFILLPVFQLFGLIFAYIPGIMLKGIVSLAIIRQKILAFKPCWMHVLVAPATSAVIVFLLVKLVASFLDMTSGLVVIVTFTVAILGGLVLHGFLTGLAGGWDDNTLGECQVAIAMGRATRVVFTPLGRAIAAGHAACPWRNKFAVAIFTRAREDAEALTREKVPMDAGTLLP